MNRREVLWALMAITLPRGGGAQARARVRRLGYLSRFDDGAALRKSLAGFGHVERTLADAERRVAAILDKVLRGANPSEISFEVTDGTELMINRTTARALGLILTPDILLRATELVD